MTEERLFYVRALVEKCLGRTATVLSAWVSPDYDLSIGVALWCVVDEPGETLAALHFDGAGGSFDVFVVGRQYVIPTYATIFWRPATRRRHRHGDARR